MNPLMNPVGSNAEGKLNCINAVVITQKRTVIVIRLPFFSTKSTLAGGWNRLRRWNPTSLGEIRLDGGWVDLISSEAKPKISSALADFILVQQGFHFLREFKFIRKNGKISFLHEHLMRGVERSEKQYPMLNLAFLNRRLYNIFEVTVWNEFYYLCWQ